LKSAYDFSTIYASRVADNVTFEAFCVLDGGKLGGLRKDMPYRFLKAFAEEGFGREFNVKSTIS
jgi:hypothetical protein